MTKEEFIQSEQTLRVLNEWIMDMYKQKKLKKTAYDS